MNDIEKMIKENRELFMDHEPANGHIERFEQKLLRQTSRKKTIKLTYRLSRIAAVGLLLIMSSLWAYDQFISPERNLMSLGEVNPDYEEMEFYFTSQIENKFGELQNSDFMQDEEFKKEILLEVTNMDSVYKQLKVEMGNNPGDERIVEEMIRHYQTKLRVITEILNKLESYNNTNIQNKKQNQYESVEL